MKRTRLDLLCTAIFGLGALLVVLLTVVAAVCQLVKWGARQLDEQPAAQVEQSIEPARVLSPNTATVEDEPEDPDEDAKIYAAILDKCQVVENCWIVGYAPELVAGWKPEYRNENGMHMTASGMWASPGCTVATDPAVIPTGATVIIEGRVYVAADRGVNGKVIDVMMSQEEALVYGCHRADVWWCLEVAE